MNRPFELNPEIEALLKAGHIEEAFKHPLSRHAQTGTSLDDLLTVNSRETRSDAGTVGHVGLTLGDFLYDWIRINPLAAEAIDFARAQDLDDLFKYALFSEDLLALPEETLRGSLAQLQGYVAERFAAQTLSSQGYDVSFPDVSNQEGWDILVDGQPFQVKCTLSPEHVRRHLERYEDIPVYVNSELADELGDVDGVHILPDLSHETIQEMTEGAVQHGADILDFEVPWIALIVESGYSLRDFYRQDTDLQGFVTNVLTGTVSRTIGGGAGGMAGVLIGLALFGPAGAVIGKGVGAVTGSIHGRRLGRMARSLLTRGQEKTLKEALVSLAETSRDLLDDKLDIWSSKLEQLEDADTGENESSTFVRTYVLDRMKDDMGYYRDKKVLMDSFALRSKRGADILTTTRDLLVLVKRANVHPHGIQAELKAVFSEVEGLTTKRRRYRL